METKLREIEDVIDGYHKKFQAFKFNRDLVILHILRVYEDSIRLGGPFVMNFPQKSNIYINSNADCLDMAIKWAYQCCQDYTTCNNYDLDGELYSMISSEIFMNAGKYRTICDAYTLCNRNRQTAKILDNGLTISFDYIKNSKGEIEAYDFIRENIKKNTFLNDSRMNLFIQKIPELKAKIASNVKVDRDGNVCYEINKDIWNGVYELTKYIMTDISELPDEWEFESFSLGEYKVFWRVLLTLSFIHSLSCMSSTAQGAGLKSCIMIKTYDELKKIFLSHTDLTEVRIKSIIDFITYNPNITNVDVIWQPLIKLSTSDYAISPALIMTSSYERNIISLINKVDQKSYSKISSTKEEIMTSEIVKKLKKYANLKSAFHRPLPNTDMDMVLYDFETKTLFIGELKWLIATDSIQEVCSRDEDIKKGVSQVKLIKKYIGKDLPNILERAFGDTNYDIENVFSCVITRNNVGTSKAGEDISIINEDSFFSILKKYNGNLEQVIKAINDKEYCPVLNIDYKIVKNNIDYAGYTFKVDSIEILNKTEQDLYNDLFEVYDELTYKDNIFINSVNKKGKKTIKNIRIIRKKSKRRNRKN